MSRGRTKRDRSRRCLLLAGGLFLAVQLAVGLVLDGSLLRIRFLLAEQVTNSAARLGRSPDIMFMGTSRLGSGLNMEEVQEFMSRSFGADAPLMFNAAVAGSDPFSLDYLIRLMAGQGITPGMAIIEVDPEIVKVGCPWMGFQITRLLTWQDMPDALQDFIVSMPVSRLLSSRIIPVFLYRQELLTWVFGSPPPYLKAASQAAVVPDRSAVPDVPVVSTPEPAEDSTNSQPVSTHLAKWFRNYRIGGINAQHFESLLNYLHQRNVPVILVGFPVSRNLLNCYTPEINRQFMDYMEYLTRACGCSFVDCRNRVPNKFFIDDLHMNPAGAVLFTRCFESEVLHDAWINFRRSRQNGPPGTERVGEALSVKGDRHSHAHPQLIPN